jgi:amino acid transporter
MAGLKRAIDLRGAISINVITMIGIGPLVTIPLVIAALGGPLALVGWIAGAIVALCDGLVWAELSSRFPGSGGTYVYLRDTFARSVSDAPSRFSLIGSFFCTRRVYWPAAISVLQTTPPIFIRRSVRACCCTMPSRWALAS